MEAVGVDLAQWESVLAASIVMTVLMVTLWFFGLCSKKKDELVSLPFDPIRLHDSGVISDEEIMCFKDQKLASANQVMDLCLENYIARKRAGQSVASLCVAKVGDVELVTKEINILRTEEEGMYLVRIEFAGKQCIYAKVRSVSKGQCHVNECQGINILTTPVVAGKKQLKRRVIAVTLSYMVIGEFEDGSYFWKRIELQGIPKSFSETGGDSKGGNFSLIARATTGPRVEYELARKKYLKAHPSSK